MKSLLLEKGLPAPVVEDLMRVLLLPEDNRDRIDWAFGMALKALVPEWAEGPSEEFWASAAGQFLLDAQYRAFEDEVISASEAARILYPDAEVEWTNSADKRRVQYIMRVKRDKGLKVYRRPESSYRQHRFGRSATGEKIYDGRQGYWRRSEVERRYAEMKANER